MTIQLLGHPILAWTLTWLVHSTLLLGAIWLFEWVRPHSAPRFREHLWRVGILASLISASAVTADLSSYPKNNFEIPQAEVMREQIETDPMSMAAAPPAVESRGVENRAVHADSEVVSTEVIAPSAALKPSPAWILWIWGLIVILLFIRLYHTFMHAVGFLGERTALTTTHRAHKILEQLIDRAGGGRPPRMTVSFTASGPVTLPGNEICLPKWALVSLKESQLEGILAHELAHCLRRDPQTLLIVEGLRRVFFMQPLLHIAARRLAELAELAADERAVELTGDQNAVAESLAECAGRLHSAAPRWGVAMAQNPSSFMHRIRRLLHPERFNGGGPAWHTQIVTAIAALVLALALPGFVVAARDSVSQRASTTIITDDDGRLRVVDLSIREQGFSMEVRGMGEFSLNDLETDVARMANGARLEIEERGGIKRKIRFERERDAIERTYWIDENRAELDVEGREWLAGILPRMMRETGINVEERATRLHTQGGPDRILNEIELIHSDYTTRIYASWLVRNDDLSDRQYNKLLDAVELVDSDYESRMVLVDIAEHEKLDDQRATRLLDIGGKIESDYELRGLVENLVKNSDLERIASSRLIEVIASIESDYEMRTAFSAMIEDSEIPADGVPELISISGREIDSDYELRILLQSLAERINSHPESALAYIGATLEIETDYERREALIAFAEHADRDAAGWAEAIKATASIKGDYERAEALIRIASRMPASEEIMQLYRRVSDTLGSHERERVLNAVGHPGV